MEKILIVSTSQKGTDYLKNVLKSELDSEIVLASGGSEARQLANETAFDSVIINTPIADEFGIELAKDLVSSSSIGVILVVKNDIEPEILQETEKLGIYIVFKPILKPLLFGTLKMIAATKKRMEELQTENAKLKVKIEEMKIIDRAKFALIQYLNMTEPVAHRYIEKQAINMRMTRKQVSIEILKTYEV